MDLFNFPEFLSGGNSHTLLAALLGWTIASIMGIFLGVSFGLSKTLYHYSFSSFEVIDLGRE
jgi:ABC-type nitrate/sulfonate/bicarbonate transport system permease component